MDWKWWGKAFLFPPVALMIVLLPVATVFLVYSMVFMGTESAVAIVSYVLTAYTLTVWCLKTPKLIRAFKTFKAENRYLQRWLSDTRLRMNVTLYGTLIWNTAYAVLQLGLGFYHSSFWFFSMAGYYLSLAGMRFFLVRHTRKNKAGEHLKAELLRYRTCGVVFLLMNLAVSLMIFFMVYWNRTFHHHEVTTIALAAFSFSSLAMAIVGLVKYRRFGSPVYSASKAIGLASACVSMLTMESTMLTTFGTEMDLVTRRLFLGLSGGVISVLIIVMALHMIVQGNKKLAQLAAKE